MERHQPVTTTTLTTTAPPNGGLLRLFRQLIIFVLGMSVVLVGIAMIVLPGPATLVIPAGLAILATEFVWAKRWLRYLKKRAQQAAEWTMKAAQAAAECGTPGEPDSEPESKTLEESTR